MLLPDDLSRSKEDLLKELQHLRQQVAEAESAANMEAQESALPQLGELVFIVSFCLLG